MYKMTFKNPTAAEAAKKNFKVVVLHPMGETGLYIGETGAMNYKDAYNWARSNCKDVAKQRIKAEFCVMPLDVDIKALAVKCGCKIAAEQHIA